MLENMRKKKQITKINEESFENLFTFGFNFEIVR